MKILHIIPSLNAGGAERLTLDICRELKQQGHDVRLVAFQNANHYLDLSKEVNPQFLPVYVRPSVLGKWDIYLEPLNQLINDFKPDVIHSHLFEAEMLSRENLFTGIKYFSHCHDNMPQLRNFSLEIFFNKKQFTDFYEKQHLVKKYLRCNNQFIAISNDAKQYFETTLPPKLQKNISLLNNAIDFKRFNAVAHERQLEKLKMVNVGSFVPKKNQQFLVEVVRELVRQNVDVNLVMLGAGPLLEEVKMKISKYGLEKNIECIGNVEQVEKYLSEANLYVHSANYEPFGLVLLEAMATGLPVVSLDGRGNRDIMRDGENGFMLGQPNADLFSEKILQLYNNRQLYQKISAEAINTAKQYDIAEYVRKLVALYAK